MTDADRETLERLAEVSEMHANIMEEEEPLRSSRLISHDRTNAAAIRSALAEIDSLRDDVIRVVTKLVIERDNALARIDALEQEVADLRARAIPKSWVEQAWEMHISVTFHDGTGHEISCNDDRTVVRYDVEKTGGRSNDYRHDTLADALRAAE